MIMWTTIRVLSRREEKGILEYVPPLEFCYFFCHSMGNKYSVPPQPMSESARLHPFLQLFLKWKPDCHTSWTANQAIPLHQWPHETQHKTEVTEIAEQNLSREISWKYMHTNILTGEVERWKCGYRVGYRCGVDRGTTANMDTVKWHNPCNH